MDTARSIKMGRTNRRIGIVSEVLESEEERKGYSDENEAAGDDKGR